MLHKCLKTHKTTYVVKYRFIVNHWRIAFRENYVSLTMIQTRWFTLYPFYRWGSWSVREAGCPASCRSKSNALFCSTPNANFLAAKSPSICQVHFCLSWTRYIGMLHWLACYLVKDGEQVAQRARLQEQVWEHSQVANCSLPDPRADCKQDGRKKRMVVVESRKTFFCNHRGCDFCWLV